jgi:hypothetical protein
LGGGIVRNHTTIRVGTAAEHDIDTIVQQQEVENIDLKGAHRKGKEKRYWLSLDPLEDPGVFRGSKS